jgi:Xaa-Pro aminopeptidase
MYERARAIITPGITEIEVFNQLQSTAVEEFGEPLTGTGNDYQCGSRGGPPRAGRTAQAGELYILDLGPAFRGYFADNARTIAVTRADETQLEAWSFIMRAFEHVEQNVRPGKSARELFEEVQAILDQAPVGQFNHHLGHGIGLFPHETPHLNPNWDDVFEEGDVFTAEPGLYADQLRAGMRIENDYLVTADGVEKLTHFPLELE